MSYKPFSERLNKELDNIGFPIRNDDRIEAFSKLVKIPRFKAEAFLNGLTLPDAKTLTLIANELEVTENWLLGKDEKKHNHI